MSRRSAISSCGCARAARAMPRRWRKGRPSARRASAQPARAGPRPPRKQARSRPPDSRREHRGGRRSIDRALPRTATGSASAFSSCAASRAFVVTTRDGGARRVEVDIAGRCLMPGRCGQDGPEEAGRRGRSRALPGPRQAAPARRSAEGSPGAPLLPSRHPHPSPFVGRSPGALQRLSSVSWKSPRFGRGFHPTTDRRTSARGVRRRQQGFTTAAALAGQPANFHRAPPSTRDRKED